MSSSTVEPFNLAGVAALLLSACSTASSLETQSNPGEKNADMGSGGGAAAVQKPDEPILVARDEEGLGAGGASASSCLSIMSWGALGEFGAVPGEGGQDAIVAWLHESSSATGEHFFEKPEINEEFLAGYDLILIQDLARWDFSMQELDAFELWLRSGGAAFVLSGFRDDGAEVPSTNQLLSFTGLNYVGQSKAGDTALALSECAFCLGSTHQQEGWNEDHPIAQGVWAVGAYQGRSIQGEGEVVAKEEGLNLAMAKTVDEGRVFLFHDDWVSFRSQWDSEPLALCREIAECSDVSSVHTYQVAQFWYNAIRWLTPEHDCFEIIDSKIVR